jgi:hypothetical protein
MAPGPVVTLDFDDDDELNETPLHLGHHVVGVGLDLQHLISRRVLI